MTTHKLTNLTDSIGAQQGLEMFGGKPRRGRGPRPAPPRVRSVAEAARETPVFAETGVLVVGGGPAGTAAAVSAARQGADVMLVERYNHLGGLSTGGLVIWIDRMTDWDGRQVIAGFARDILDRLPKEAVLGPSRADWGSRDAATAAYWAQRTSAYHGIVTWAPTVDPEALKTASLDMVDEAGVRLALHAWAAAPIVEDGRMRGAIFESKEGRRAVLAEVVVDATGDADLLARAGAPLASDVDENDIHHCVNTAFLVGGVEMERWLAFRAGDRRGFAEFMARGREEVGPFEKPFVSWRSDVALFMGPRLSGYDPLDVGDLTEVERRSRALADRHASFYRAHAPGFSRAFPMLVAPQIGVRHSRRLSADRMVTRAQWDGGAAWDDEIGVSPSLSPKFPSVSVPYGALLPRGVEGALGAGRHIACDATSHSFLREIPQCWMSGQAAGVAAALAAEAGVSPRALSPIPVRRALRRQGVWLSSDIAPDAAEPVAAVAG